MISKLKKYAIILIVSSFIILFFILTEKFNQYRMKMRGIAERFNRTTMELSYIAKDIQLTIGFNQDEQVPNQMDSLLHWLESFSSDWKELIVDKHKRWFDPNSGALVDAWSEPIKLEVKSEKEYVLISSGPNKTFDGGQGDDITYSFNPYEFKEERDRQ